MLLSINFGDSSGLVNYCDIKNENYNSSKKESLIGSVVNQMHLSVRGSHHTCFTIIADPTQDLFARGEYSTINLCHVGIESPICLSYASYILLVIVIFRYFSI